MPRIRRDDQVKVIAGKDRGKTGRVLRVEPKRSRVFVEGLNIVKRHTKPRSLRDTQRAQEIGGIVVSDKADKTITVRVDMARQHRRYGKIVRTSSTLHAHDESNDAHIGDTVRIVESRPLSRTKRWRLVEVLERAR